MCDKIPELFPEPSANAEYLPLIHCPRCENIFLCNIKTGEIMRGMCNTYSCEYCGYRKARKLQNALHDYFKKFRFVRFWTFTISSRIISDLNKDEKISFTSEVWRRFLTTVRRDKTLSKFQQKFQYVKVLELQKNESPHYHCFFDRFIQVEKINKIWETTIRTLLDNNYKSSRQNENEKMFTPGQIASTSQKVGNAHAEGIINAKNASGYVTKYLMKSMQELKKKIKFRIWSKSSKVRLFKERNFYTPWRYICLDKHLAFYSSTCLAYRVTSQEIWSDYLAKVQKIEIEHNYIANSS